MHHSAKHQWIQGLGNRMGGDGWPETQKGFKYDQSLGLIGSTARANEGYLAANGSDSHLYATCSSLF
jgi:hypothetical protein